MVQILNRLMTRLSAPPCGKLRGALGRGRARGVTLIGLMFWAIVVAFVALIALRVFPTVNEYWTVQKMVEKIAKENPSTVLGVRNAFERQQSVEYGVTSIKASDLDVTKDGSQLVIRFAYDKEIELFNPVFLVIKYRGEGRS